MYSVKCDKKEIEKYVSAVLEDAFIKDNVLHLKFKKSSFLEYENFRFPLAPNETIWISNQTSSTKPGSNDLQISKIESRIEAMEEEVAYWAREKTKFDARYSDRLHELTIALSHSNLLLDELNKKNKKKNTNEYDK